MESGQGLLATISLGITEHVQCDTVVDVLLGADAINGFLHFAVTTVAALHGVGGGWKQFVVEKRQSLVEIGRLELAQNLAHRLEATYAPTQLASFANAVSVRQRRSNKR